MVLEFCHKKRRLCRNSTPVVKMVNVMKIITELDLLYFGHIVGVIGNSLRAGKKRRLAAALLHCPYRSILFPYRGWQDAPLASFLCDQAQKGQEKSLVLIANQSALHTHSVQAQAFFDRLLEQVDFFYNTSMEEDDMLVEAAIYSQQLVLIEPSHDFLTALKEMDYDCPIYRV